MIVNDVTHFIVSILLSICHSLLLAFEIFGHGLGIE